MPMRGLAAAASIVGMLALAGCAQRAAQPEVPAVLTHPTPESRTELVRVVREAMNGAPVTLADDALTAADTLIVERHAGREAKEMNLQGRDLGKPAHFRLIKSGSRCVLVHVESGQRWTLASATCAPR